MPPRRPNHNRARPERLCCLVLAAGLLIGQGAQGASYLQDAFNYAPGVLGANLPWTNSTSLITVVSGGLTSPALADFSPPGNAVNVAPGTAGSLTARPFDTAATSGSVYFSFLIKFTTAPTNYFIAGLLPANVGTPTGNPTDPCDFIVIPATGEYNLGIRAKGQGAAYAPSVLTLNTVYFAVVKYVFSSGTASLYLFASPGGSEPTSPNVVSTPATGLAVPNLDHLFVRVGGTTAGNSIMDSLRVASTWAEVTPLGAVSPATKLAFTTTPTAGIAGSPMTSVVGQLQNAGGLNTRSSARPISSSGAICSLTPTPITRATFTA